MRYLIIVGLLIMILSPEFSFQQAIGLVLLVSGLAFLGDD